ncbi:MAG TPA: thioredoxin domain-containing protein [Kofleriaceae bacterium]|nr:thioredoxin domain-containing protein [Kofleriaceae bacterium]
MANRLAGETSPYLLQHAENPVDWYPWGDEAFARARAEDRPIFLSIGYAACHWCHVMAHESFENPEIAALMNSLFVNVKVDREERPDVDAVYMNAIHVMGEHGGWPLSAFCDAGGAPYYLGTYYPPDDKHGRPGFGRVLKTMAEVFREKREQVEQNTSAVLEGLRRMDEHFRRHAERGGGTLADLDQGTLIAAGRQLAQTCDPHNGGLGSRPKFPSSSAHDLLGRAGRLPFGKPAREAFLLQCEHMAAGGIYDHLGGGFARYSVDERWLVPHFEKMLYDNGQLLSIYGDAFAMTGAARHAEVIEETVAWLEREMLDPAGGLFASQDADSEGEEGKFYAWTPAEVAEVLGGDADSFCRAYGVTEQGNFEHGASVLSRVTEAGEPAEEAALAAMRRTMFEARRARIAPATDTKVLSSWNGLALSGLLRAHQATGSATARRLAGRVADFLAGVMLHGEGRIWRVYKDGRARMDGTIDDYAMVARGFLAMAEATGDQVWWQRGAALVGSIIERFYGEEGGVGVFYLPASDSEDRLVHRPESNQDGAMPSGSAVALECMVLLGRVAGDGRAMEIAERYLAARAGAAASQPYSAARLLAALDLAMDGVELVVTEGAGRAALDQAAGRAYAPTLARVGPWAQESLLAGKTATADGRAQAYVCRGQTCSAPVSDPAALVALLGSGGAAAAAG